MRGHVRKKDGNWYVVLELERYNNSGGRCQRWIGVRKALGLNEKATKRQAEDLLVEKLAELRTGTYIEPHYMTLQEYLLHWLEEYARRHVKPKTFESYDCTIRLHIIPEIGHVPLADLKPFYVQTLLNRKLAAGRADGKEGGLSRTSVRYIYTVLNIALKQAKQWELVQRNICESVTPPKKEKPVIEYWSHDNVQTFLHWTKHERLYPLYLLALSTGMRQGELLGLRWEDISGHAITVNQTLITTRQGQKIQRTAKTDGSRRTLEVSPQVVAELNKLRKDKKTIQLQGLVFRSLADTPLMARNVSRNLATLIRQINRLLAGEEKPPLKHISFHGLRHTYATLMLSHYQVDVRTVADRLGHTSVKTTLDTYAHVIPNRQKEAALKTDDLVQQSPSTAW